jgi:hypothetical protein
MENDLRRLTHDRVPGWSGYQHTACVPAFLNNVSEGWLRITVNNHHDPNTDEPRDPIRVKQIVAHQLTLVSKCSIWPWSIQ